jgi:hypothetical protein
MLDGSWLAVLVVLAGDEADDDGASSAGLLDSDGVLWPPLPPQPTPSPTAAMSGAITVTR